MASFRNSVTKMLNPKATTADLGEVMEAYYDADKKVWVFPGEDPAELAKPIGPPPTTPVVAATAASTSNGDVEPAKPPSNDPLAAMMAPPTRLPSRPRGRTPGAGPPGFAPMSNTKPPQFAMFTPPPASAIVSESHDTIVSEDHDAIVSETHDE